MYETFVSSRYRYSTYELLYYVMGGKPTLIK